ncbi:MAG: hypothetical protein WB443_08540 [Nitrososphaeraceae archaeon]
MRSWRLCSRSGKAKEAEKRQQVMQQQIIEQGILGRQSKTKKEEWSSLGCIYNVLGRSR